MNDHPVIDHPAWDEDDYDYDDYVVAWAPGQKRLMPLTDVPLPEPVEGSCEVCGCPPDRMPMVFRGTGWCSENHRKELKKEQGK